MAEKKLSSNLQSSSLSDDSGTPVQEDIIGPSIQSFKAETQPINGATLSYSLQLSKEIVGPKSPGMIISPGVRLDFNICIPDQTEFQILDAGKSVLFSSVTSLSFPKECVSGINLPLPNFPLNLDFYINIISPALDPNKLHQIGGTGLLVVANINGNGNGMALIGNRLTIGSLPPTGTILDQYAEAKVEESISKFSAEGL